MVTSRILAVDIGASHVAAGLFGAKSGRLTLEQIAIEALPAAPLSDDGWPRRVARSMAGLAIPRSGACVMTLPGHLCLAKHLRIPSLAGEPRERSIAFEAAENIPLPLAGVAWIHHVVADDGRDLDLLLVAAKTAEVRELYAAGAAAGFDFEHALAGGLALKEAFQHNYADVAGPVMIANVGARSTGLLYVDGTDFRLRTVALGGNSVTEAVAKELGIDFSAAEALKIRGFGGGCALAAHLPSRAAVERAAVAFGVRLLLEIRLTFTHWCRQRELPAAGVVYLTGSGAGLPGLPAQLENGLTVRVERLDLLRKVGASEQVKAALADGASLPLAELVGAAAHGLKPQRSESSLLPETRRRAVAARKRRLPWMVATALALLTPLPMIRSYHQQSKSTLAMAGEIGRQLAPMRTRQADNEEQLRQIELAKKRLAALEPAFRVRGSWSAFLAELQAALVAVEDVWLERLRLEFPPGRPGSGGQTPGLSPAGTPQPGPEPTRLFLAGRLLDVDRPQAKAGPQSYERVKRLLRLLRESPFVTAAGGERFDSSQDGMLGFEVTLTLNPARPL